MDKFSEILMNLEDALWGFDDIEEVCDDMQSCREFTQSARDLILHLMQKKYQIHKEKERIKSNNK